jgi:rubrerythrin
MAEILDIVELLGRLASIEGEGVAFYKSLAQHTQNAKVKKLGETLARVERRHQLRFEELSKSLEKKRKATSSDKMDAELRQYFMTLIDHRVFDSPEGAATIAKNLADGDEAVDIAIRFEKDNILLLLECKTLFRGEARKLIDTFIGQEKEHIRSLQKIRTHLARMG